MKLFNTKEFIVSELMSGKRVDYFISRNTGFSRKRARDLIEAGFVLINKILVSFPSRKISTGDRIALIESPNVLSLDPKFDIIYEDAQLMVVNKPPYVLTNKESSERGRSLEEILSSQGKSVYPVHRLDRETTGVVIFAKDKLIQKKLIEQFKSQNVKKKYLAIVFGRFRKKIMVIRGKLKPDNEYAKTSCRILELFKIATLLELYPKTGRTHQIRRQLAQIGYPIIGDKVYNPHLKEFYFPRQALHALEIKFIHPATKRWLNCSAPIPVDMKMLIKFLRD